MHHLSLVGQLAAACFWLVTSWITCPRPSRDITKKRVHSLEIQWVNEYSYKFLQMYCGKYLVDHILVRQFQWTEALSPHHWKHLHFLRKVASFIWAKDHEHLGHALSHCSWWAQGAEASSYISLGFRNSDFPKTNRLQKPSNTTLTLLGNKTLPNTSCMTIALIFL